MSSPETRSYRSPFEEDLHKYSKVAQVLNDHIMLKIFSFSFLLGWRTTRQLMDHLARMVVLGFQTLCLTTNHQT